MPSVPTSAIDRPLGRVTILGLGLMGGSVARAVSGLQLADQVVGWSPRSTEREAALTAGALTFAAGGWREAVADAELVVLAAPLEASRRLLEGVADAAPEGATITDVASLKAPLAAAARACGISERWVGSHPMAGGVSSGFWASRADLFEGARVWIVAPEAEPERVRLVERLWVALGAEPMGIEAEAHDRLMASVSHLPQLVATALAEVLEQAGVDANLLGPGGRDMTRLASSSPDVWSDILAHASPVLIGGLRGVAQTLQRLADRLDDDDADAIGRVLAKTRRWRDRA